MTSYRPILPAGLQGAKHACLTCTGTARNLANCPHFGRTIAINCLAYPSRNQACVDSSRNYLPNYLQQICTNVLVLAALIVPKPKSTY